MTKSLLLGLGIFASVWLCVLASSSFGADCNQFLLNTSWQCTLTPVDGGSPEDFDLSFFNQSGATMVRLNLSSMIATGPYGCEMKQRTRRIVSGKSFLATLFNFGFKGDDTVLTLTGRARRRKIVRGNGLFTEFNVFNASTVATAFVSNISIVPVPIIPAMSTEHFVYACDNPAPIQ